MYGSDWTVSELTHAYPEWVAILDEITAGCSDDELRSLYRDTAIRTYRLDDRRLDRHSVQRTRPEASRAVISGHFGQAGS